MTCEDTKYNDEFILDSLSTNDYLLKDKQIFGFGFYELKKEMNNNSEKENYESIQMSIYEIFT